MTFASKETSLTTKVVASVVSFAAALFMLGLMSVPAQAQQTNAELRAQIQSLLDTISQLQSQVDGQSSGSTSADPYMNCNPAIFDARIGQGASGQGVVALQQFLNMSPDTQVAQSGPGSPGNETSFYGPLTAQAVTAFQEKYSSDILAPVGLSSGTGYWGSSTASKAQELCTTNMTGGDEGDDVADGDDGMDDDDSMDDEDDSDDADDEDESDEDDEPELSGGEASLEDFDISSGDDGDVQEGESASVADVEFDVENGDVRVSRADLAFRNTDWDANNPNGDTDPWDVYEEVMLMGPNGDELASVDVSSEDDWLDDDPDSNGYFEVRMTDLGVIVEEDDTAEMSVAVEVGSSVDDVDDNNDVEWDVNVLEDGIRARDGAGIDHFIPEAGDVESPISFDIEAEGAGEELNLSSSSDDPDEAILPVEEDDTSDEYGVFAFDMEAEENDIDLDRGFVKVDFDAMSYLEDDSFNSHPDQSNYDGWYDDIVSDAYLEINGEQFDVDDETVDELDATNNSGVTSGSSTLEFDFDEEYTIEEDEEVTATLFVEFEGTENYNEGITIQGSVADDGDFTGEGADDVDSDGTATGDEHTVLSSGIYSQDAADIETDSTENFVQYTFDVNLTAFEDDAFVDVDATGSASDTNGGDDLEITSDSFDLTLPGLGSNNTTSTLDTFDVVSTADEESDGSGGDNYVIREGDTEEFTVTVEVDTGNKSSYRAILDSVDFNTDGEATYDEGPYEFTPESDYRSDLVSEEENN